MRMNFYIQLLQSRGRLLGHTRASVVALPPATRRWPGGIRFDSLGDSSQLTAEDVVGYFFSATHRFVGKNVFGAPKNR